MGRHGAELLSDGDSVIHHCNTGALATVDYGTALGVIRTAHEAGKHLRVLVDETRPRLQGSRLTAWELEQCGIPYVIIADGAAGLMMRRGEVQAVLVGADRVAANGDVANKIGTYMLALAAQDNKVPFYCVVPTTTIDPSTPGGDSIPIEERDGAEVLDLIYQGQRVAPEGSQALNPAFDITPARLVTAFVTEAGVLRPPFPAALARVSRS
jgi:methylthioribose-1-phosphate isomerase